MLRLPPFLTCSDLERRTSRTGILKGIRESKTCITLRLVPPESVLSKHNPDAYPHICVTRSSLNRRLVHFPALAPEHKAASQTAIPTPTEVLGFTPGDDRKLASWDQVVEYFKRLDQASDRVMFEELGKTSMGKPFVMATISSPANLARLDEYKEIQDQLADPRKLGPTRSRDRKAAELIRQGKTDRPDHLRHSFD